jgi:hypothetical protein
MALTQKGIIGNISHRLSLYSSQRYLGKISDAEAMRWIDNLHG